MAELAELATMNRGTAWLDLWVYDPGDAAEDQE